MPADKSLFQSRRQLAVIQEAKAPEKKRFRPWKLLPFRHFKRLVFFKKFLPNVLVSTKKRAIISFGIFILVVIGGGAFGYYQYLLSQNPAVIYQKKLKTITDIVSQQIKLPTGEQPVIATVSNVSVLPKEAFFKAAQDGDKILMYKKHKEAFLYRPSTGKVITYASLEFKDITPTPAPEVAGASTSAAQTPVPTAIVSVTPGPTVPYIPQGKILIQPE